MIVKSRDTIRIVKEYEANICWLGEQPLDLGRKYLIKHTTKTVKASVTRIAHRVDVNTLELIRGVSQLYMNDIARVCIKAHQGLAVDSYSSNRSTGSFIVIDDVTNNTVGAGMII
jgi:sulfate adenylyltransferase subunit 1